MKRTVAAILCLLLCLVPVSLSESAPSVTVNGFTVAVPEGWTSKPDSMGASLYSADEDACISLSVTDLTGEVSALPLLTALGDRFVLTMFAHSMFSCSADALTAFTIIPSEGGNVMGAEGAEGGFSAVRMAGKINRLDTACAAVCSGPLVLSVICCDLSGEYGNEALLDGVLAALSCPDASPVHQEPAPLHLGSFMLPCPENAHWETVSSEASGLFYDSRLVTVSAQWERNEGTDAATMVDTLGTPYLLDSAFTYFGGEGIVTDGDVFHTDSGILAAQVTIDPALLYESMLGAPADVLMADYGYDVTKCTAAGLLLMEGEYTDKLTVISADESLSAEDVCAFILSEVTVCQ